VQPLSRRRGQGDGTGSSGAQPSDLTDAQWDFGSSDGEIFAVIHDGTSDDMASYASRLTDTEIWNVVNYLRTLAPKPVATARSPLLSPAPTRLPPDPAVLSAGLPDTNR
jgi:mono/diheme cytochrome c family protein